MEKKIHITHKGLLVPIYLFNAKDTNSILKSLTIKEKQVRRNIASYYAPVVRKAYKGMIVDGIKYIIFPRNFLTKLGNYLKLEEFEIINTVYENDNAIDNAIDNANDNENDNANNNANDNAIDNTKFTPNKILYPYQVAAVDYIFKKAKEQYGILYLQMDTGLGKSRVGCAFVIRAMEETISQTEEEIVHPKALIVVPTKAIADQWVGEFSEMYPNLNVNLFKNEPKAKEGKITRKKKEIIQYDIDIIVVNTFREKDESFVKGYLVTVLDEAHEYHSECNLKALWLSQTKYVLGLSATPIERPDGLDRYITLHLGDVVYPKDIPNFDITGVNFKGMVKIIEYEGSDPYCEAILTPMGTVSSIMTINNILNDPYRLALVVNEILLLNNIHLTPEGVEHGLIRDDLEKPKKHGIFVFVETRDFLIKLRNALLNQVDGNELLVPQLEGENIEEIEEENIEEENIEEIEEENIEEIEEENIATPISILRGGITKQAFTDAREAKAHIVLTTYGYSRRGISLPDMTALVLVSPRRNGSRQIIGRILRRNSDEGVVRQIIDIVDVHTVLKGQSNERIKIYKEKFGKQNIKKVNINWESLVPIKL
jgi:superfamily II DNA or RNA helicase